MKDSRYIIQFLFSILFSLTTLEFKIVAQKQIDDQLHGWVVYQGNHHLSPKFDLHTEYQWRRADGFADWQQSLARIGLDYKFNKEVTFSGGYGGSFLTLMVPSQLPSKPMKTGCGSK